MNYLAKLVDGVTEKCKAIVEQRSPFHGARYWLKAEYPTLMSAIGHNDPFQRNSAVSPAVFHKYLNLTHFEAQ